MEKIAFQLPDSQETVDFFVLEQTRINGARSLIMKVERDELVEELLKAYIEHNAWE